MSVVLGIVSLTLFVAFITQCVFLGKVMKQNYDLKGENTELKSKTDILKRSNEDLKLEVGFLKRDKRNRRFRNSDDECEADLDKRNDEMMQEVV